MGMTCRNDSIEVARWMTRTNGIRSLYRLDFVLRYIIIYVYKWYKMKCRDIEIEIRVGKKFMTC